MSIPLLCPLCHNQFNSIQSTFWSTYSLPATPLLLEVNLEKGKIPVFEESPTGGGSHMNTRCYYSAVSSIIIVNMKCEVNADGPT